MNLISRDITDEKLIALHLCFQLSQNNSCDGVYINHRTLQRILGVERIYEDRAIRFAKKLSPVFPYHKLYVNNNNATTLGLGLVKNTEPTKYLSCNTPPFHMIEKSLGIDKIEIKVERKKIQ